MQQSINSMWEGDVINLVSRLAPGGSWKRDEYLGPCPMHQDSNLSSFHFNQATRLWECHASCGQGDLATLVARVLRTDVQTAATRIFNVLGGDPRQIVATYPYMDAHGSLVYEVVRYEPKCFCYRRPERWSYWNLGGPAVVQRIRSAHGLQFYRLPEVLRAKDVLVVEGEKDCETARAWGLLATCNAGGAGNWPVGQAEVFRGKRVAIIADADESGRNHAREIAADLLPVAESVKVMELPGAKDLSEWAVGGGTREKLMEILEATRALSPEHSLSEPQCLGFRLVQPGSLFEEPDWPLREK
jgi:hypothetical protein